VGLLANPARRVCGNNDWFRVCVLQTSVHDVRESAQDFVCIQNSNLILPSVSERASNVEQSGARGFS